MDTRVGDSPPGDSSPLPMDGGDVPMDGVDDSMAMFSSFDSMVGDGGKFDSGIGFADDSSTVPPCEAVPSGCIDACMAVDDTVIDLGRTTELYTLGLEVHLLAAPHASRHTKISTPPPALCYF